MAVLADAALDEHEREVLDRLVGALADEYGDDLEAVWLYGSRARGERPHDESDVDVLVATRSERDDRPLIPILWRVRRAHSESDVCLVWSKPPRVESE